MLGDKETDKMASAEQAKETPPPAGSSTEDPGITAGKKSQVTAEVHQTEPVDKDLRAEAGGGVGRIISTRSAACDRRAAETALSTSLRSLELENNERNIGVHKVLCRQLLGMLDKEHQAYVRKEGLSIENEPEKSYLKNFSDRVTRAVERKRSKFVVVQPRSLLREALRDLQQEKLRKRLSQQRIAQHSSKASGEPGMIWTSWRQCPQPAANGPAHQEHHRDQLSCTK